MDHLIGDYSFLLYIGVCASHSVPGHPYLNSTCMYIVSMYIIMVVYMDTIYYYGYKSYNSCHTFVFTVIQNTC